MPAVLGGVRARAASDDLLTGLRDRTVPPRHQGTKTTKTTTTTATTTTTVTTATTLAVGRDLAGGVGGIWGKEKPRAF
jgi:hypothetical protein